MNNSETDKKPKRLVILDKRQIDSISSDVTLRQETRDILIQAIRYRVFRTMSLPIAVGNENTMHDFENVTQEVDSVSIRGTDYKIINMNGYYWLSEMLPEGSDLEEWQARRLHELRVDHLSFGREMIYFHSKLHEAIRKVIPEKKENSGNQRFKSIFPEVKISKSHGYMPIFVGNILGALFNEIMHDINEKYHDFPECPIDLSDCDISDIDDYESFKTEYDKRFRKTGYVETIERLEMEKYMQFHERFFGTLKKISQKEQTDDLKKALDTFGRLNYPIFGLTWMIGNQKQSFSDLIAKMREELEKS